MLETLPKNDSNLDNVPAKIEPVVAMVKEITKWGSKEADFLSKGSPVNVTMNVSDLLEREGSALAEQKFQEFFHQFSLARGSGWDGPDKLRIVDDGRYNMYVNFTNNMGKALAFAIAHCPRLKSISLKYLTSTSPCALQLLFEALPTLPALSFLSLAKIQLSAEVLASLQIACSKCKKLSTFGIIDPITVRDGARAEGGMLHSEAISSLCEALSHLTELENLDLHRAINGTEPETVFLGDRIRQLPKISLLSLGQNALSGAGAASVARSFGHLPALEWLNMSRKFEFSLVDMPRNAPTMNHLIRDAARELVKSMSLCSKLLRVDISEDIVSWQDGRTLGEALASCPSLEILFVHSCFVYRDGALGLASCFPNMARLRRLVVEIEYDWEHPEGDVAGRRLVGLNELVQYAHELPALEEATLKASGSKRVRFGPLLTLLRGSKKLKELRIDAHPLSEEQGKEIADVLREKSGMEVLEMYISAKVAEENGEEERGWQRAVEEVRGACTHAGICARGVSLSVDLVDEEEMEDEEGDADYVSCCEEDEEEMEEEEDEEDEEEHEAIAGLSPIKARGPRQAQLVLAREEFEMEEEDEEKKDDDDEEAGMDPR